MTTDEAVREAVEGIVADRLRVDRDAFDADTPLAGETLDADSLDIVETAEAIDANLDVHIPDEDLETLETVGDLTAYVRDARD